MPLTNRLIFSNNSGNVGIGTTNPTKTLSVNGSFSFSGTNASFDSNDANSYPRFSGVGASAQLGLFRGSGGTEGGFYLGGDAEQFSVWSSSFSRLFNISSTGNVSTVGRIQIPDNGLVGNFQSAHTNGGSRHFSFGSIADGTNFSGVRIQQSWDGSTNDESIEFLTHNGGVSAGVRAVIDKDGNFGIGINSPTDKLTVSGGSNGGARINGSDNVFLKLSGAAINEKHIDFYHDNTLAFENFLDGSNNFIWRTRVGGLAERMRINSAGTLLVALTDSNNYAKICTPSLGVYENNDASDGGVYIGKQSGNPNRLGKFESFGADSGLAFWTNSGGTPTERIRITSGGNVGIGTTAPSERLHVSGTIRVDGTNDGVRIFKDGSAGVTSYVYLANAANNRAFNFQLNADGSAMNLWTFDGVSGWLNKFTFAASGNLGIGTDSPSAKLEVVGTVNAEKFRSNGVHYVGITGFKASNASAFDMFDIGNTGGHQTIEIVLSHHHSGGGQHGSFRRTILALNAYTDLVILEDVRTNFGGGSGFTITRTNSATIRIGWSGATGFSSDFYFTGWIKGNGDYTITNVGMNSLDVA